MIRSLAILLICMTAGCAAKVQRRSDEVHLRATVQNVWGPGEFSGTVIPVGVDAWFAVTVKIVSATPASTNFMAGATVTFAVHSPTQLFYKSDVQDVKGKTFDFVLSRDSVDGRKWYSSLEVRQ